MESYVEELQEELRVVRQSHQDLLNIISQRLNDLKLDIAVCQCPSKLDKFNQIDDINQLIKNYTK